MIAEAVMEGVAGSGSVFTAAGLIRCLDFKIHFI